MTTFVDLPHASDRRVQVWFGRHLIADYVGGVEAAAQFEAGMRQRFVSLRVTNEPAASSGSPDAEDR
ncbi:hypothetical protein AB0H36_43990 [Kribbella sp. NPDC050820]|uniref:hypothetical protein n=1 Tax=Kribbella sp. NPDC050820 TaxID=3155408 RepID=UPI0033C6C641